MYKKIVVFLFLFSAISMQGRVGRISGTLARGVKGVQAKAPHIKSQVALCVDELQKKIDYAKATQVAMQEFIKSEEFGKLVEKLVIQKKEELANQCAHLKKYLEDPLLRKVMVGNIIHNAVLNLWQVTDMKGGRISTLDIGQALFEAVYKCTKDAVNLEKRVIDQQEGKK